MWGYQAHFRLHIQHLVRDVLKDLGVAIDATTLLVGVRRVGSQDPNSVCVEPEDGRWSLSLFNGLLDSVEVIYSKHELQHIFYGDEPSNRGKPEMMRRDSVTTAVNQALRPFDREQGLRSFCGMAQLVGDYYVTPVIQVPEALFRKFPPLDEKPAKGEFTSNGYRSIIHAALSTVLQEASVELQRPEPGHSVIGDMRKSDEIIRIAAKNFMYTPSLAISNRYEYADLFSRLNLISSLLYEGAQGVGRLLLANPSNPDIEFLMRFREPVSFGEPRWMRKILQLTAPSAVLIADCQYVYGLGRLRPSHKPSDQNVFTVDFLDHYHWELKCGDLALLRSQYGEPTLPNEIFEKDAFTSNLARLFPESTDVDLNHIWSLFNAAARQDMGSMIVVAEDALSEAQRLAHQGTGIEPVKLSAALLQQVSSIDGTILLDPQANCHAIGVILDGEVNDECTPSRGSRFNSAVRYVRSGTARRLAIVVSDDRTVDIFPTLRPRASRKELEGHIEALVIATVNNYHAPMNWLNSHRFYLDAQQCAQINAILERIDAIPLEVGEIRFVSGRFDIDPSFDQSYLME
ncbi:hypothetical protein VN23_12005 [Janthinobacterium sp. B9-8]|nr:hypothetical protein VN23_12005 [Janthinobacterium sp. B9-8]